MACPVCGERCRCPNPSGRSASSTSVLIDPESPEPTEEQFAASLEASAGQEDGERNPGRLQDLLGEPAVWRQEIASRVEAFCARRGRKRTSYAPSLRLDFERGGASATAAVQCDAPQPWKPATSPELPRAVTQPAPEEHSELSNVIEFPRPAAPPAPLPQLSFIDELAEPIIETPRILEAEPEDVGLQFGGQAMPSITLDPPPAPPAETFPEAASLSLRAFAGVADGVLVVAATGVFALIVSRVAGALPTSRMALAVAVVVPSILWALYEYLFFVHCGATPGMKLAGLELRTFDAFPVPRRTRRWRAIAMMLSGSALGLGFIWAVIDEDGLCWHDRISRTLLRPR